MEQNALNYIKDMLDKATQKGVYNLSEVANVVAALEKINQFINQDKTEDHGKEEN